MVWADAWARVFSRTARLADISDAVLIYRFVPMAVLLMVQATYFIGRAYPFLADRRGLAVLRDCDSGGLFASRPHSWWQRAQRHCWR